MRDIIKINTTCEDGVFTDYTLFKDEEWLLITGSVRKCRKLLNYDFEAMAPQFIEYYEFNGIKFEVCDTSINCLGETLLEVADMRTGEVKEVLIDEYKHYYIKVTNIEELFIQEPLVELE